MDSTQALQLLDGLAAPARLALFRLLVRHAPHGLVAGELAAGIGVAANAASFHLKALTQAGLVAATAEGRFLRYRANTDAMRDLIAYLGAECCEQHPARCGLPSSTPCGTRP